MWCWYINYSAGILDFRSLGTEFYSLLEKCNLPFTGKKCVHHIVTDMALIDVVANGFLLREYAPGFTAEEIQKRTGAPLHVSKDLREMQF